MTEQVSVMLLNDSHSVKEEVLLTTQARAKDGVRNCLMVAATA